MEVIRGAIHSHASSVIPMESFGYDADSFNDLSSSCTVPGMVNSLLHGVCTILSFLNTSLG